MPKSGTVSIDLKVSLMGQGLVTICLAAILAVMFYVQLSLWLFLGAFVVLVLIWAWLMHRINRFRWRRLTLSQHGDQVVLIARDKYREAGKLKRRYIVSSLISCFSVEGERGRHLLCLFPDSTDQGSWRRLVASLKAH